MATLASIAGFRSALYRLLGTSATDQALIEHDNDTLENVYLALTHGCWAAQRYMISAGMAGRWRKRSTAITSWSGSDAADGGRYTALPTDFLRLVGNRSGRSALRQASGETWGTEVEETEDTLRGAVYYLKNDQLWLGRGASPPGTIYIDYHFRHPEFTSAIASFDFPLDARGLIVAEAAGFLVNESWVPGGPEMDRKVEKNLAKWRTTARDIARRSREPRRMRSDVTNNGPHWFL